MSQGKIRVNNVLVDMHPYGCWTKFRKEPNLLVHHSSGKTAWPMRMSSDCRYDKRHADERCVDCMKKWDENYVRSLT